MPSPIRARLAAPVGLRRPNFPSGLSQERLVIGVTVVLVLAAVSSAVIVSGGEGKPQAAAAATTQSAPAETPPRHSGSAR